VYRGYLDKYQIAIEDARQQVERAAQEYSRGGSLQNLNRANRELADCHDRYRECYGLRVGDKRQAR
jgi:hypothetical protein